MQNPKNEAPTNQSTGTPTAQAEGNNTQNQTAQQTADEKRFTQADVDKIVGERLNREREKLEAERKRETMKQNARAAWLKAIFAAKFVDTVEYRLTCDTSVQEGKTYYTNVGFTFTAVTSPTGNPEAQDWYEAVPTPDPENDPEDTGEND